ncbi:hypothetical protein AX15_006558 [Amanita polypyramis BW_CC]|nr:hypothetical protein AX15_006558 [Amanita polypyramis BW_CC]
MSTSDKAIVDYLTKQLYIEKTIVTYRSLSREFGIHVNLAKNELAKFHAEGPYLAHPVESFATYLVSGELYTKSSISLSQEDHEDDNPYADDDEEHDKEVDGKEFEYGDSEPVLQIQMSLVSEENLELTKARYRKIYSIHVYSLTPSPLRELRLICAVAEKVYEADSRRSLEMTAAIGRIVNPEIKYPIAGPSKPKERIDVKGEKAKAPQTTKVEKRQEKPKEEIKPVEKAKEKLKPTGTGKLDFFKPRPKETKKEEALKTDAKAKTFFSVAKKEPGQNDVAAPLPARGTKRKSIAHSTKSESEDDTDLTSTVLSKPVSRLKAPTKAKLDKTASTSAKPARKVMNSVIASDEDVDLPRIPRRKSRLSNKAVSDVDSEAEKGARALMDIDDEHVIRATHSKPAGVESADVEKNVDTSMAQDQDVDIEMEDEVPRAMPKQRKPRKVAPVGRNGLKKRRATKTRTKVDEKGYMVTEDYSSYESVDEEDTKTVAAKSKGKGKAKEAEGGNDKNGKGAKGKKGGKGGQASLANFFGPPKAKR